MAMRTGENEQGLKKVIDMTRLIALAILLIHIYFFCYQAFFAWGLTAPLSDKLLENIQRTGLLTGFWRSKLIALGMLLVSLLGVKARKNEKAALSHALGYLFIGVCCYYFGGWLLAPLAIPITVTATCYIILTTLGVVLIITGGSRISRIVKGRLKNDVFNKHNETFPQEERLIKGESSINIPARYNLKGKQRKSWINLLGPRGIIVLGNPGSGKSRFIVEPAIRQFLASQHTMCLFDFKYPDLTQLAYHHFLRHYRSYEIRPRFYIINFDDLNHSHRCNPLDPANMHDITDAVEAARVLMLGLNRSWVKRQGEFFVESPINFVVAIIWFLRRYEDGRYCTLPHVIEMMLVETEKLFTVLATEPEILAYIQPFISAYQHNALEQLEGQLDAAKIGIARLSSPTLYYVLSGNDFSLDLNNPKAPKILSLANNPQKLEVYGPVLSLYMTRISRIINQKGKHKCAMVIDEFASLTFLGLDTQLATARSNKISTLLALQSESQLRLNYGKEWADVVLNICGNIVVGQVAGELTKSLSERLGKTLQDRENISINSADTSISRSKQLELAVPVSTISSLSSGEMVGIVADTPDHPIALKTFHAKIELDEVAVAREQNSYLPLPVTRHVTPQQIREITRLIQQDVQDIVDAVLESVLNNPGKEHLLVRKK